MKKNILIVEDEPNIRLGLERIIKSIDQEVAVFKTGYASEALEFLKNNIVHAFLLDIQLVDYSGIDLAEKIRMIDAYKFTPIVFITAIPTKEMMAFRKLHSYDYILKPFEEERVRDALEPVINVYEPPQNSESRKISLKSRGVMFSFKLDEIIYIEAMNKRVSVKTVNESAEFSKYSLGSISDRMDSRFVRCHRSYLVNRDYVEKIDKTGGFIYLKNTQGMIPIGRKFLDFLDEL
jgi:two-component system LytT family response regulator